MKARMIKMGLMLISVLTLSGLIGCTRAENEKSQVKLVIPTGPSSQKVSENMSQSLNVLTHVIVNVHSDKGFRVFNFDACQECGSSAGLGSEVIVELDSGENQLIQVLAVYQDGNSDGGAAAFFYGDDVVDLNGGDELVEVLVAPVSSTANLKSGRISGRYLTSANVGPTGHVDIIYEPELAPPMVVMSSAIYNGWFSFFGLEDVPFSYYHVESDSFLFADMTLSQFIGDPNVMYASIPSGFRSQSDGGQTYWKANEGGIYVYGNFGYSDSNMTMKYENISAATNFTSLKVNSDGSGDISYGVNIATDAFLQTSIGSPIGPLTGSVEVLHSESGSIISSLVTMHQFNGQGNDTAAGIQGVFSLVSYLTGGGRSVQRVYQSNSSSMTAYLLPGLAQSYVQEVVLFKKDNASNFKGYKDEVPCQRISQGLDGFYPVKTGVINGNEVTFDLSTVSRTSSDRFILCPKNQSGFFDGGMILYSIQ